VEPRPTRGQPHRLQLFLATAFIATGILTLGLNVATLLIGGSLMAARKQFQTSLTVDTQLSDLLQRAQSSPASEEELREQRVSFAFGNAPQSDLITKDSVRCSSENIRLIK
jgi:hypothetical protein